MGGEPTAAPEVLMEGDGSVATPHEMTEAGGFTASPEALTARDGFVAMPSEIRETSPPAREQGAGSKRSCPNESGKGLGVHPQNIPATQRRQSRPLIPLFSPFLFFYFDLMPFSLLQILAMGPLSGAGTQDEPCPSGGMDGVARLHPCFGQERR